MGSSEKETVELYEKIFPCFKKSEFNTFQEFVSPKAFKEDENFFRGKRVLEFGCGGLGYSIMSLLKYGAREIVGVDLSPKNIANLENRFAEFKNVQFLVMDICYLPSDLGEFDLIYSNGVIHHVKDPEKVVANIFSLLRPGGTCILGLYGKGGVIPWIIDAVRFFRFIIPRNILFKALRTTWRYGTFFIMDYIFAPIQFRYTEKEAIAFMEKVGFKGIERLDNVIVTKGVLRYLQQFQVDYRTMVSRILHGHGYIILKGKKF